jgi:AcrR family transcriptional regulator
MALKTKQSARPVVPKLPQRVSARDRLLAAADELFYAEGVHVGGVDRIVRRAGVTKASLYNTFGSKDELVRAYLEAHFRRRQARIAHILESQSTPR